MFGSSPFHSLRQALRRLGVVYLTLEFSPGTRPIHQLINNNQQRSKPQRNKSKTSMTFNPKTSNPINDTVYFPFLSIPSVTISEAKVLHLNFRLAATETELSPRTRPPPPSPPGLQLYSPHFNATSKIMILTDPSNHG